MRRSCIVLADASRARLFTFEELAAPVGERTQELRERVSMAHPARRMRPSELFSDTRPGSDRTPTGRGYAVDDHRDASIRHMDRQFAIDVVDELERLLDATGCEHVILAATPHMLGLFRDLTGRLRDRGVTFEDIDRNLVRLSDSELQDRLAERGILPSREHFVASP